MLTEKYLNHFFEQAQIGKLDASERNAYEDSLKYYRDLKNSLDTAKEEGFEAGFDQGLEKGKEEGRFEGRVESLIEVAKKMLAQGLDCTLVANITGLSLDEINALR